MKCTNCQHTTKIADSDAHCTYCEQSTMTDNDECVSRFFKPNTESVPLLSPKRFASETEDPDAKDTSQSPNASETNISLSQLTIKEHQPLNIQPFYNITPREMPLSPNYVVEEEFATNPWAMLIATIFLTKTSAKIARPFLKAFFEDYPTPYHVLEDDPSSLEKYFETLGLRKRACMIWRLSYQFVSARWRRASDLCGIGKYGEDAYRIFCLGHTDLDPGDRYLKLYLDWLRGQTEFLLDNGVEDSEYVITEPILNYYSLTIRDDSVYKDVGIVHY